MDNVKHALSDEITPNEFQTKFGHTKPDKNNTTLIFMCRSGKRALAGSNVAQSLGYQRYFLILLFICIVCIINQLILNLKFNYNF